MRGLSARFTDCPPTMPPTVEEVGSAEASTPQAWPKTTAESPSSTQNQILLRRNITAEMATVLRKQAPILIRLREKLGLQLCTVFHSTLYAIIQTRNAPKLRLMQNRTRILCNDTCSRQAEFMHKTEIRNSAHVA